MRFTAPRLAIHFYMHSVPFTEAVLRHETSLGGSESACRVLAEALAARGHDVHIFATQLEAPGEYFGVFWQRAEEMHDVHKFAPPDVFVSLRMPDVFAMPIPAKLRIFWTQDLLIDTNSVGQLFAIDKTVFVSQYHREQWCNLQTLLRPTAWVTNNPIDPADLEAAFGPELSLLPPKIHRRLIHISRPERGVDGLLAIWPTVRSRYPDATLAICRYSSMYDKGGWGKICESYDKKLEQLNAEVGGIVFLGELDKRSLYREIQQSVAMLYPTTQPNFAETNCVAATEAQACGTPIIATRRGALPETVSEDAGILIDGDVLDVPLGDGTLRDNSLVRDLFVESIASVFELQEENPGLYARMQLAGRVHAQRSHGPVVAEAWEQMILATFEQRYASNKVAVMRTLLHWHQHAHALRVAKEIIADHVINVDGNEIAIAPGVAPALDEAHAAADLCGRVIRQEALTADQYAQYALQDPLAEAAANGRLHEAADRIARHLLWMREAGHLRDRDGKERPARILDVSCGNGAMALCLLERTPADTVVHGVDYSAGVIELAREATSEFGRRVRFWAIDDSMADLPAILRDHNDGDKYDAVFCGEFIEHVERPWVLLDELEAVCAPAGRVILTTPCGPFAELRLRSMPVQLGHVHAFTARDLSQMGAEKLSFGWSYLGIGDSPRGTPCGYWIFGFQPGGGPGQPLDYDFAILTERPYQRLNASMIVKNGADWLTKCLNSLYCVVDRVQIVDFGSDDGSVELAEALGADVVQAEWPEDFSVARNLSLALAQQDAEWILWIDADEHLNRPERLRDYVVDGGIFNGYVVRQQHLCADQPTFEDKPIRLFRTGRDVRFFGVVHEQPETALDKGITPALDQQDVKLVHFGYEDEAVRRDKMKRRNLPLLMKEITGKGTHPPRKLAWLLYMRDCVMLATWSVERANGRRTKDGYVLAQRAIGVYTQHGFDDPSNQLHDLAWPFYQQALTVLGKGYELAFTFAAAPGRLKAQPRVERWLVASPAEAQKLCGYNLKKWTDALQDRPTDVEPFYQVQLPAGVDGITIDDVRKIVGKAAPHSWGDDRRVMEWCALFLEAVNAVPDDEVVPPILEIGTYKGASALLWLELLKHGRLDGVPVVTVDPYGRKPYDGGNKSSEALYGEAEFTSMKALLASYPNHFHFPIEAQPFLLSYPAPLVWSQGRQVELNEFQFVLLDGEHSADAILAELSCVMGSHRFRKPLVSPTGIVVVDNVDADPATIPRLLEAYPMAEIRPAKWGQAYAVIRGVAVQTSAERAA